MIWEIGDRVVECASGEPRPGIVKGIIDYDMWRNFNPCVDLYQYSSMVSNIKENKFLYIELDEAYIPFSYEQAIQQRPDITFEEYNRYPRHKVVSCPEDLVDIEDLEKDVVA